MHLLTGATCSKYHPSPYWFPDNKLHPAFLQCTDSHLQHTLNTINQGFWLIRMNYIWDFINTLITRCKMLKIPLISITVPRQWIASSISSRYWLTVSPYSKYPQSGYLINPHALHWTFAQCIINKVQHAQNTIYLHTDSQEINCIEHFFKALNHSCNILQIPSIRVFD